MLKPFCMYVAIFTGIFSTNMRANQSDTKPHSNIDHIKLAAFVLENDNLKHEKEDGLFIELEDIARPEIPKKKKEKAYEYISKFAKQSKNCKSWKEFQTSLQVLSETLDTLFEGEDMDKVEELFSNSFHVLLEELIDVRITQFIDEYLKNDGLLVETPNLFYWVYFETDHKYFSFSNFKKMRSVRFKIRDSFYGSNKEIENADLVLLNKDGFEIGRTYIGRVDSESVITGKIELTESDYSKLRSVTLQNHNN